MEQAQEVRDPEQVEVWVEAAVARARAVVARARAAVGKVEEVVLRQVRAATVSALTVVKDRPINWGFPVMSSNVLNAGRP